MRYGSQEIEITQYYQNLTINSMKPQYQRSNQALKAYYKNVNPTPFGITTQSKHKKLPDKQIAINHQVQKSNQDIDWLEKIVNGFEWYKDKHDPLFIDNQENMYTNPQYKQKDVHEKNLSQVEIGSLKNKDEYSQRIGDNKIANLNNSNRSNLSQKNKEIKNQVNNKNSNFAKNIVYSVKNKRSQSEHLKRKQYSVSISQLTGNRQKAIQKQKQNERELQRQRQKQKFRRVEKTKEKEKYLGQKQNKQKDNMVKYMNIKKQTENFNQTRRNICDFIEVCGITDITNNIQKMKSKMSIQQKNNIKLSSKIATIKAQRKNLREVITEQKSRYGKIIKNKSVELKQQKKTVNTLQNAYIQKQMFQIEDQYPISGQKSNKFINESQQGKYLVKQFNDNNENFNKLKQKSVKNSTLNHQTQSAFNLNINNEIQRLILKEKQFNQVPISTTSNGFKQKQTTGQKAEKFEPRQTIVKNSDKKNQTYSIRQQNQNKKYYYLIDRQNIQERQSKISVKKQRKLNSSFGERKLIYNYNQHYNQQKPIQSENHENNEKLQKLQEKQQQKQKSGRKSLSGHVHTISFSSKKEDSLQNKMIAQKFEEKQIQKQKVSQLKSVQKQKKQILQGQKYAEIYQNVRFVESIRNSQVLTEHSMSIVLDKHLPNPIEESISNTPNKKSHVGKQQWDIMDIFSKLDCRKLGVLSANNCSIQYISRQIRYILGPVLEQILYRNINYTFTQFIQRVERTLQHVKDSQICSYKPQMYLKVKQWAPQTQRIEQQPRNYETYQQELKLNNCKIQSKIAQIQKSGQQSSTKKYQYTKTFYQQFNTQPSIRMKKKQNKQIIRFATFQDQDIKNKDTNGCLVFQDINLEVSDINHGINQNSRLNNQEMEQKLQRKLATLNNFQSTFGTGFKQKMDDEKLVTSIIRSRCRSDAQKTEYKNQIVKLQLLNQRLQRYLHDQTLKQYSTSKLLDGEI